MKKIALYSLIAVGVLSFTGCTQDSDVENKQTKKTLFVENFDDNTDNTTLNTAGWTNYAQLGTKVWTEQIFDGNGYAEFTSFGSGQALNVAWLISPPMNMDAQDGEKLSFQSAHNFLTNTENTLELFVSTDYDGNIANFTAATWENIPVRTPTPNDARFLFINSGDVDLSGYQGTLYFAFKTRGSGSNTALDATFQVDNIRLFY